MAEKQLYQGGPELLTLKELVDPDERRPYEEDMGDAVRNAIQRARQAIPDEPQNEEGKKKWKDLLASKKDAANLILQSLQSRPGIVQRPAATWAPHISTISFASWLIERGILLGPQACHDIGTRVCQEMIFTTGEAADILQQIAAG